jgi:hypothetical protein
MSVNVKTRHDALKMKAAICACLVLGAVLTGAEAGSLFVRAGGGRCPPARAFCPPTHIYSPVICGGWQPYSYPFSAWSPSPVVASTTFSNVSLPFDYGESGVYRVPAPVIPPPPIINSPGPPFTWRH